MVTTAQANTAAIDNETLARLVEAGFLDRVRRGAYAATAAGDDPLRQQKAAWLLLNSAVPAWQRPRIDPHGGVLSHRTAALIHGVSETVRAVRALGTSCVSSMADHLRTAVFRGLGAGQTA